MGLRVFPDGGADLVAAGAAMNGDRVKEIRARLDAATPGPWEFQTPDGDGWFDGDIARAIVGPDPTDANHRPCVAHGYDSYGRNADLIAHAPADIAWLLDEVERLNKRVRMYEVVKS